MRMTIALALLAVGCAVPPDLEQLRASGPPVLAPAAGTDASPADTPALTDAELPDPADTRQAAGGTAPEAAPDAGAPDALSLQPDTQQADSGVAPDTRPVYGECREPEAATIRLCNVQVPGTASVSTFKNGYACAICQGSGGAAVAASCTTCWGGWAIPPPRCINKITFQCLNGTGAATACTPDKTSILCVSSCAECAVR
jgi:hypothetical protein